jgi:hypothetical protein
MNYPPRPWVNGQRFIDNGVTYTYDLASNSWRFSNLTYNRLCRPITLPIADAMVPVSLELEFSLTPDFIKIVKSYYGIDQNARQRMYLFDSATAQFSLIGSSGLVSFADNEEIYIIPEIDLANRYFCRYRWVGEGVETDYKGFIY